ncbi:hypothetical protein Ade02nite_16490 [Paractinoplanes deccanensis]|uniref:Fibronectin type-III domain-containing protein n=1 Tax=Paractinoplanes deccanensis TaxID=113561 RepID=A0ABQ3XZ40_9ACTN|nr:hypothetical protein Ade02nite_16490 [Actinoplanes deccanensis]
MTVRRSIVAAVVAVLAGPAGAAQAAPAQAAPAQARPGDEPAPLLASPAGAEVVKDRYIVMLKGAAPASARSGLVGRARARGATVRHQYTAALNGFSATLSADALAEVRRDPNVVHVEPVLVGHGAGEQPNPPSWGLDRIDQPVSVDKWYKYTATGQGVRVYVIDSGINRAHQEFTGRVDTGYDYVDDDYDPADCNGHGTHVAGTAAGATAGVAKEARIIPLRVLNCAGEAATDDSIAAFDWVTSNHPAGTPGVVNFSIGHRNGTSVTMEAAITRLINNRSVTVVVAAGNDNGNACDHSPGRLGPVLTVASVSEPNRRASDSNWGACVDLFAPGEAIKSADWRSTVDLRLASGTSMAAPHVAGAAALHLQSNPGATPAQVHAALVDVATTGVVVDPKGSPNRLLYLARQNVVPQSSLENLFNNYGNNAGCADWSGADATQSVPLPSGKRAWFFADTYLNNPGERAGFFRSSLRNSVVVQNGSSLRTITGGNTCREHDQSLPFLERYARTPFAEPGSNAFYWPGDAMIVGSNVVKFFYRNIPQPWLWTDTHSAVASIPISALESGSATLNIQPTTIPPRYTYGEHPINWGLALVPYGSEVLIYGASIVDAQNNRKLYLAKSTPAGLTNPSNWAFYAGGGTWSTLGNQGAAVPVANDFFVENGFSVAYVNGRYWLVQHEPNLDGGNIVAHAADLPWGFTARRTILYTPPEGIRSAGNRYKFYYEARIHPGLAARGRLIVSYNVNTSAVSVGCRSLSDHDGSVYRPRFLEVPLGRLDPTFPATSASPAPVAELAADYGWYDSWAPAQRANGGCPPLTDPTTLDATVKPDGTVDLAWSDYGQDMWYWVESRDVTAGAAWSRPALWRTGTSMTDIPVMEPGKQGHTFEWRVVPFANGSPTNQEAPASNVVQRTVTVQAPAQVTGVVATRVEPGRIEVRWDRVTSPSDKVYYFIDHWNISAGQTEDQATRFGPMNEGTQSATLSFTAGDMIGFRVRAQNVGGFGPPSERAVATA